MQERSWAILIATFSNYLGWAFGNIGPCYYFNMISDIDVTNNFQFNLSSNEMLQKAFDTLLFHQMFIMMLPFVILAISLKNKPEFPPSYAAVWLMK